jgi:hypothetical protein
MSWANNYFPLILPLLFLVVGCKGVSSDVALTTSPTTVYSGILQPHFFEEDKLNEPNFPFWFNPMEISQNNIKSIQLKKYVQLNDSLQEVGLVYRFFFYETGVINSYQKQLHYQGKVISEFNSDLKLVDSLHYYSLVKPKHSGHFNTMIQEFEINFLSDSILIFNAIKSDMKKVFLIDPLIQNVIYADLLDADKQNITWHYGSPRLAKEAFRLNNVVEKANYESVEFQEGIPIKKSIRTEGRLIKRHYHYKDTRWIGYTDSVQALSGSHVLLLGLSLEYNDNNLPSSIHVANGIHKESLKTIETWKIEYEFFE